MSIGSTWDGQKLTPFTSHIYEDETHMAQVFDNIVLSGLTGSLGDKLVLRRGRRGQTIVSKKPVFAPDREFSAAQKEHQQAFREAAGYAKAAKNEPVYLKKAEKTGQAPYNVAVADWFNKPQIVELDVTAWNGQAGQPIRIRATDDVQVMQVFVVISDGNGTVLEQGAAFPLDAFWWSYVTTAHANGNRRLLVTAQDRPGHKAQTTWQN
jgi:hypothetical protein